VLGVVQTCDLFPSILEWAGVPAGTTPAFQQARPGFSEAMKYPDTVSGYAFAEEDFTGSYDVISGLLRVNPKMDPNKYPTKQIAVHGGTHKYIWHDDRPATFHDLRLSPDESTDVSDEPDYGALRQAYEEQLAGWRSQLPQFPPRILGEAEEPDEETRRRLVALGYIE
jgi:hypothetical protein